MVIYPVLLTPPDNEETRKNYQATKERLDGAEEQLRKAKKIEEHYKTMNQLQKEDIIKTNTKLDVISYFFNTISLAIID